MKPELITKFNNVIHYSSDYVDSGDGGLKKIILKTSFEVESNGTVRIDLWLSHSDFFNSELEPHIYFKHQTAFELKRGQYLNKMELVEMFRFTETEFLNAEIRFDDSYNQTIREIFRLNDKISEEEIL
jgi:hypothetical protein